MTEQVLENEEHGLRDCPVSPVGHSSCVRYFPEETFESFNESFSCIHSFTSAKNIETLLMPCNGLRYWEDENGICGRWNNLPPKDVRVLILQTCEYATYKAGGTLRV